MKLSDLLPDISIFKKAKTQDEQLSSTGAYNLWNSLRARYTSLESHQLYRNFVHDRDFDLLLDNHIEHFQDQINILEELAEKHKIKMPPQPPENLKISAHIDALNDKLIFRRIYSDLISELYLLSRSISSTIFNDELRRHFMNFIDSHLKDYENLYKYGKMKGWTNIAPTFKTHKPTQQKKIAAGEAGHILEHINLRYDQLQLTRIFVNFVHDEDLKLILEQGQKVLEEQIKTLENLATKYEVPLPEKPPAAQKSKLKPDIMKDEFMYRIILKGIQDAIELHIRAIIETIRNDSLRNKFFNLYNTEVEIFNNLIKYGKMKGWTYTTPEYREA